MTHRTLFRITSVLALALAISSERPPIDVFAQQAGPRAAAGAGQTETRLGDGRWLIVSGDAGTVTASIWDPVARSSAPTAGPLIVPRWGHSATLLSDGTVLIAGGRNATGLVPTAEVFEPATGLFRQVSIAGATPRASHTATLLMDGRVLVAGGTAGVDGALPTEIWNITTQSATPVGSGGVNREGHKAALMPDGTVLLVGGRAAGFRSREEDLILDPATGRIAPAAAGKRDQVEPAVSVSASIPTPDATDVETDMHVALRFSAPVAPETVTGEHVTLTGPTGVVTTVIVTAEGGRLAFVWPDAPLADGAVYTVTASGLADASGRLLASVSFHFTTRQRPSDQADAVDPEAWSPDAQTGEKGWRTNRPPSPWESLAPLMAPPGVTAVSGRVLRLDGAPLKDVTLQIEGHATRTDGTGRFLLPLDEWTSRATALEIDGATASKPNRTYGFYEARIAVYARQTNVLPFTIWSPRIDTVHQVTVPSPTTTETLVTTPTMPGLELHLPAGTVIYGEDHDVVKAVSITPIPLDRTPFPLPVNATFSMFFTIQPGGAYLSTPGPIKGGWLVYPNVNHSRNGRVQFFNYDPDDRGWYPYGMGTIAGASVVPEPKTRIYGFTGASFNDSTPTPPNGRPPGTCRCDEDGDPVNLATGIFSYEITDLVVPDVMPLVLTRSYNSQDPYNRAFGTGMSHSFGMFQHSEGWPAQVDFYLPDGGKIHFDRISDPALNNNDTVFAHTSSPTGFFQARMARWENSLLDAGWQVTLLDGTKYLFPHAGSPLQAIRDRHGNEIRLTWESGLLRRVTSPNGRWIAFTYGSGGRVSQVSDNIGRTVSYTYDANGNLLTVTDPEQHVTSYGWTANNQMATVKPRNLYGTQVNLVTNEYTTTADAPTPVGWVKKQTHADGGLYQFAYTVSNGRSTQTDVTDPRGHVRRVTFSSAGYQLSDTRAFALPEAQTTTSDRPETGSFVMTSIDALQAKTTLVRDSTGNVTAVTRCKPNQTPCTDQAAGSLTTRYTYDPRFQQVATVTDPLNHTTTYGYDDVGNLTSVTDPLQHQTTFGYNAQGQVTWVKDALQHTTNFSYTNGDLTTVTDSLSRVTRRFIDAGGRLLSVTDPLGQTTRYTYDRNNRVVSIADPLGGVIGFSYFPDGELQAITDANQHTKSYTYDVMGRLATRIDPLQRRPEAFGYDVNGNLQMVKSRKGEVTANTYDSLDRLQQITYADGSTIGYTYTARNQIALISDSISGDIVRTYNDFGDLASEATPQGSIAYTYDSAGRRETMTVTGQSPVTYTFDDDDRLTGLTNGSLTVGLTYDDADRRATLTLPNGIVSEYGYDDGGQLITMTYRLGSTAIGDFSYSYDLSGQRVATSGGFARTQLPQALASATYDAANELTAWGTQLLTYDENGRLVSKGLSSYAWNVRGELTAVTGAEGVSFEYDGTGRRIGRTPDAGEHRQYLHDRLNPVREFTANWTADMLVGRIDEQFGRLTGGVLQVPLTDAIGSVVSLSDSSGAQVASYHYSPFGSTVASGSSSNTLSRFTSREQETSTLYYYRARFYDSEMSRFISEDPLDVASGSPNLYAYVSNSPVNWVDPLGLQRGDLGAGAANAGQRLLDDLLKLQSCAEKVAGEFNFLSQAGAPRYAHCMASCTVMKRCGGSANSALAGYGKEVLDLASCLKSGSPRGCSSAMQPSDFADNALGRNCPANKSCEEQCEPLDRFGDGLPGPFGRWPFIRKR